MNQTEWTQRTKNEPTAEEWVFISAVYTFHPLIGEVTGKEDIAKLFKLGGIGLIESMVSDADKAMIFETNISSTRGGIRAAKDAVADAKQRAKDCEAFVIACERGLADKVAEFKAWKERFNR